MALLANMRARIAALVVTYGDRWRFLSQVLLALAHDPHIQHIVVVDNASLQGDDLRQWKYEEEQRHHLIKLDKNTGSAGGFAAGIEFAQSLDVDFIFILDDDIVPESGSVETFLHHLQKFKEEKVVLVGNRVNLPGNEDIFYQDLLNQTDKPVRSFFNVLSFKKIIHFMKLFFVKRASNVKNSKRSSEPKMYVPNESFVYGGAFIPIEAIRKAPLPDTSLVLYGDDIEYSWGIKRLGYASYVCFKPELYDIDMSFGGSSQAVGLFAPASAPFKTYFRIRNMIRISIRNTTQSQLVLACNIFVWITGLCLLGLRHYGFTRNYLVKLYCVFSAIWGGYIRGASVPKIASLP